MMNKKNLIRFILCFAMCVLCCETGFSQIGGGRTSSRGHNRQYSNSSGGFSCYMEEMNIFNLTSYYDIDIYTVGVNLSFGNDINSKLYIGGGTSIYYLKYSDYGFFSMDFFADIKYAFMETAVTPVIGCKLGAGFLLVDEPELNVVTRPSVGILFRLRNDNEMMVNVEYLNACWWALHALSLNLCYKF